MTAAVLVEMEGTVLWLFPPLFPCPPLIAGGSNVDSIIQWNLHNLLAGVFFGPPEAMLAVLGGPGPLQVSHFTGCSPVLV